MTSSCATRRRQVGARPDVDWQSILHSYPRFILEAMVLWICFRVIRSTDVPADKSAAWAIIGLIVSSIINNLQNS